MFKKMKNPYHALLDTQSQQIQLDIDVVYPLCSLGPELVFQPDYFHIHLFHGQGLMHEGQGFIVLSTFSIDGAIRPSSLRSWSLVTDYFSA